ncbi:unnamed protein product [Paramecium pentaurelia]|uniref:Transmembrane protein n=1 Tax=Paramecium pentaurelia TaxID=43138 RepID=A0A8S1T4F1_9CILI|nr:unnamed protein product [Paramecium pentaurelia]CAD8148317.1 unnamed protein product [Paramecium pentaurelia]
MLKILLIVIQLKLLYFHSALNGSQYIKYFARLHMMQYLDAFYQSQTQQALNGKLIFIEKKNIIYNKCMTKYVEFVVNFILELYNNINIGPFVKVLYNGEYVPISLDFVKLVNIQDFVQLQQLNQQIIKNYVLNQIIRQIEYL